jgi:multidrug efflux system membrane fusion protein
MRKRLIMLVVLVPVGVAAAWYGLNRAETPARTTNNASDTAVPVFVAEARRDDVPIFLTGLGTVRAYNSVLIRGRVDGQILRLDFAEGQVVHAGDTLVEIDPKPFDAQMAQAQAGKLKDEAQLANAKLDLTRASQLATTGVVTEQQRDVARALVDQLDASTKVDQAVIDAARVQLGYTIIRSPIDGRAGIRLIDAGNLVRSSDTAGIVTINQIRPISVEFDLPADALPRIRARMKLGDLSLTAVDGHGHDLGVGKLTVIDNHVDVATATVRYKSDFDNSDEALWPGQFVSVRLQLDVRRDAITVPVTAVQRGPDGTYVFIVDTRHIVDKRSVTVGFANSTIAIVDRGIQPGDQVVTDGQYRIQAGTLVSIVPNS